MLYESSARRQQISELRVLTKKKSDSPLYALLDDILEILQEHENKLHLQDFEEID